MDLDKKHTNSNIYYLCDVSDKTALKNEIKTMEYPFFTLSRGADKRIMKYQSDGINIKIVPSILGLPTLLDKDILIYVTSLVLQELNSGREPLKTITISVRDYLKATDRSVNSIINYKAFNLGLQRLCGCRVHTNLINETYRVEENFNFISNYFFISNNEKDKRIYMYEITLSDWYFESIVSANVLTLNEGYFKIKKPIERRLYEIARKHCGYQEKFTISLEKLYIKSGSTSEIKKFKFNLKKIIEKNSIPDYIYSINSKEIVTIDHKGTFKNIAKTDSHKFTSRQMKDLKKETLKAANDMLNKSQKNISLSRSMILFIEEVNKQDKQIKDLDLSFLSFLKNKILKIW